MSVLSSTRKHLDTYRLGVFVQVKLWWLENNVGWCQLWCMHWLNFQRLQHVAEDWQRAPCLHATIEATRHETFWLWVTLITAYKERVACGDQVVRAFRLVSIHELACNCRTQRKKKKATPTLDSKGDWKKLSSNLWWLVKIRGLTFDAYDKVI